MSSQPTTHSPRTEGLMFYNFFFNNFSIILTTRPGICPLAPLEGNAVDRCRSAHRSLISYYGLLFIIELLFKKKILEQPPGRENGK
jgi:hypothetical protein